MKFNELNTPFCKIPMLTYGCDGKKAVRHYVEVQPITNTIYKSRTEMVNRDYEQCRIYVVFPDCPVGLDLGALSFLEERYVEEFKQDSIRNGLDTSRNFLEAIDRQVEKGGFIGNPLIEFVRHFDPNRAEAYAKLRRERQDALKQQKMESEKKRLMEKEEEEIRLKQEKEKKRAALLGWGDTMTELQLGRVLAILLKVYRYPDGVQTSLEHTIHCISDGYHPEIRNKAGKRLQKEYRLVLPQENYVLSFPITKTEYEFASYLYDRKQHEEKKNI